MCKDSCQTSFTRAFVIDDHGAHIHDDGDQHDPHAQYAAYGLKNYETHDYDL